MSEQLRKAALALRDGVVAGKDEHLPDLVARLDVVLAAISSDGGADLDRLPHQDSCRWWRHGDLCDCGAVVPAREKALAALASVPEGVDEECATGDCERLREKMAELLSRTAVALRGEPPPLTLWSWHDLPELAAAAVSANSGKAVGVQACRPEDRTMASTQAGAELLSKAVTAVMFEEWWEGKEVERLAALLDQSPRQIALAAFLAGMAQPGPKGLRQQLQQKCSDWGAYWRAPDAHGVELNHEQALELLRDALGVEVEIKAQPGQGGKRVVPDGFIDDILTCASQFSDAIRSNNTEKIKGNSLWMNDLILRGAAAANAPPLVAEAQPGKAPAMKRGSE